MAAPFDPIKRKMFPDVYDNINKIQFDVYVKENYSAVVNIVHNSAVFGDQQPPPIMEVNDFNYDDLCHASLTTRYIVDALVNGKFIQFRFTSDMMWVQKWLKDYISEVEGIDLSDHPDYIAFIANAKKALHMLDTNIMAYNDIQINRNPKPVSVLDILANL